MSESLLGVKLVKANPNLERSQDYSFINRLIIWTAISKSVTWLVQTLMKALNSTNKDSVSSRIGETISMITKLTMYMNLEESEYDSPNLDHSKCAICRSSKMCMPYISTGQGLVPLDKKRIEESKLHSQSYPKICNHSFCYYCIRSLVESIEDEQLRCGECKKEIII